MFDLASKRSELEGLEERMARSDFWNDPRSAGQVGRQARSLKETILAWEKLHHHLGELRELWQMATEEGDEGTLKELEVEADRLVVQVGDLEFRNLLSDVDDPKNAILEINSGAGGTEAADWAGMLMRMYTRWAERSGFETEVMDLQAGDEAGIKSATLEVRGSYAYGYLKAEAGVHRLVRISPFDSNSRRHTSFASVFAYPEVGEDLEIELKDEDLKIDVYRAGGAGGQHVNKTSSAVRITHLPTGIVVQCQNERSQLKNKGTGLKILKARVYQHFKLEEQKKIDAVESTKKSIEFGSQIRSYVFQPYSLVKDVRTGHETGNVQAVMDGELDGFIKAFLLQAKGG
ncbi:MAG: peptide chain release factor 2 [Candidatus Latescibacteria bacterium]|nr:peptide chain release factor 2 [Candidatus Latescibacterota bacterium]